MSAVRILNSGKSMATPWRRRRMCVLIADQAAPAALREISANGAFLETSARPRLGDSVELRHPDAGAILGRVQAITADGIAIVFSYGEASVAYALAAVAADMTQPAG